MKSPLRLLPVVLATLSTACLLEPWSWRDARDAQVIGDASPADVAVPDGAVPGDVAAPDDAMSGDVAVPEAAMPDVAMPDVVMPDVAPLPDDVPCPSGTTRCGGACVALASDPGHCGTCETACAAPPHAAAACVRGACSFVCEAGARDCNDLASDGCEALTATDVMHCGACGRACPAAPHARPNCAAGACSLTCDAGWGDCDGDPSNGCEVNLSEAPRHCGRCGNECPSAAGASPTCAVGRCGVVCDPGQADCDRNPSNGCEASTTSDARNCGACGMACAAGQVCSRGRCGSVCLPGDLRCGDACVSATAPATCGSCSNACPARPHADATCTMGTCGIACEPGHGDCDGDASNGCEVDTSSDARRCGACGNVCPTPNGATATCRAGVCGFTCTAGFADCDGNPANGCEADTRTSAASCGACGNTCPTAPNATPTCAAGACGIVCNAGFADCDRSATNGCEVDLRTSPGNCGACGNVCVAAPGATVACVGGTCGQGPCAAGFGNCDGNAANGCEASTATDVTNCGACGTRCAFPNAAAVCARGVCALGVCTAGYADCDGNAANGCEVRLADNGAHCGACGRACPAGQYCAGGMCSIRCDAPRQLCGAACVGADDLAHCGRCGNACMAAPNASATCSAGACGFSCASGFADCDGSATNGCETTPASAVAHCGRCGNACPTPAHGVAACVAGSCGLGACDTAWANCDGSATNGCEVDTRVTVTHCGACGNTCPAVANGAPACTAGRCGFVCNTGFADCDRNAANGCEVDLRTSTGNCGACGNVCPAPAHGVATCASGACATAPATGWADCDAMSANGYETNTATDPVNCGACGTRCAFTNAAATCASGACALGACSAGYANCDGNAANGCEVRVTDDGANCGACGRACPAGQFCAAGACVVDCRAPSFTCGSGASAVCVAQGDVNNCGGCGLVCPGAPFATAVCASGSCTLSCVSGYADCDGVATNGCETIPSTSVAHCGRCGNACPTPAHASPVCARGVCGYTCASGWGDCNGNASDGCEVDLRATAAACGACGTVCPARANATATCAAGVCGFTCNAGFADCDGNAANGCEVDTRTSVSNCGRCGNACPASANATAACGAGTCGMGPCLAGWSNCNGNAADGCEVSTATDATSCGACGNRCAFTNAAAACASGACALGTCNAGYANCDGNAANGCEVNTSSDSSNCGACGTRCDAAAGLVCSGGRCGSVCTVAGETFCSGACVNTATSTAHCGRCGNACATPAHATAGCASGACGIAACASGWANCNSSTTDGCEVSLLADNANCGRCGNVCPTPPNAAPVCRSGTCGYTCNPGWMDCDGAATNGCEASVTALTSCGGCGVTCSRANATATCATGTCAISSCNAGWGNCDSADANGCETGTTSTSNCQRCAVACTAPANAAATCTSTGCGFTCSGLYRNCDSDATNGCEVLANTTTNCGACGRTCSRPHGRVSCSTGTCTLTGCLVGWSDEDGIESNGCETAVTTCTCPRCPINSFCDRVTCSCETLL